MQISQRAKETIDACRFCWMCRHICPIGNATGQERNTSRARALSLSLVERGGAELNSDILANVYECALCGACTKDCATGWDPVGFTKETRLEGALTGIMPEFVDRMLGNLEQTGNIYGETDYCDCLKNAIAALPKSAEVLLYIGTDGRYKTAKNAVKAIELLTKADVNFTVLADEPDSGYHADFLIGAADETRKIMENTASVLNATGAKTVVVYDPNDAKVFLREYKEWDIALSAQVVTFTAFVASLINDGKLTPKKSDKAYTFQDPALLARDLEETAPARKIIDAIGENREMLLFGKDTMLAGSLVMSEYLADVMKLVAQNRIVNAQGVGAITVVTACPSEYVALTGADKGDIQVISIEEAVLQCL